MKCLQRYSREGPLSHFILKPKGSRRREEANSGQGGVREPVYLYDAHDAYMPPAAFDRRFGAAARSAADLALLERWFIHDKKKLTRAQTQSVLDAYDDGIAYLDEQVGELIDGLDGSACLATPWS